ncbi:MAG: hypothetical protein HZA63_04335 [Rhodocyclales bacterium]|nr:hypothetical protein [Rhodocyclales bacterium]
MRGVRLPLALPRALWHLSVLSLLAMISLPAAAQALTPGREGRQLQEFRQESEAFNRQDPFANAFRAGHYNGYLAGMLDALQGHSVCFRECTCELDTLVGRYLTDHPEARERPVAEWLVPLLEARYPCRPAASD